MTKKMIELYPTIKVRREGESYLLDNGINSFRLEEFVDIYFDSQSWRDEWEEVSFTEITISVNDTFYQGCNLILSDRFDTKFCIYDCEYDRWLCISNGEVEWTTSNTDSDIAYFQSEEAAIGMIPSESFEDYGIQTRIVPRANRKHEGKKRICI